MFSLNFYNFHFIFFSNTTCQQSYLVDWGHVPNLSNFKVQGSIGMVRNFKGPNLPSTDSWRTKIYIFWIFGQRSRTHLLLRCIESRNRKKDRRLWTNSGWFVQADSSATSLLEWEPALHGRKFKQGRVETLSMWLLAMPNLEALTMVSYLLLFHLMYMCALMSERTCCDRQDN